MLNTVVRDALKVLAGLTYPLQCAACRQSLTWEQTLPLCSTCHRSFPVNLAPFCESCGRHASGTHQCRDKQNRAGLDRIYFMWRYENSAKRCIQHFKIENAFHLLGLMRHFVRLFLKEQELSGRYDCIVPIPASRRMFARTQSSHLIAGILAREINTPVQYLLSNLKRLHKQSELSRLGRLKNSKNATRLIKSASGFKSILLVDDVLTTGFTAMACAKVLKHSGVERVDVFACARGTQ